MIRKHADSIGHALNGLQWAIRTQHNYRAHIALILLAVTGGFMFQITYTEWLTILALSVMGLIIETLNTSIEQLGDAIDRNFNDYIKRAKDVSAGAMLIYAIGASIAASIIFIPHIIKLIISLI